MADQIQQSKSGADGTTRQKFSEMSTGGKLVHVGKVFIFIISFGFAFPTLFSD